MEIRRGNESDIEWMAMCHWHAYREHTGEELLQNDLEPYMEMARMDLLGKDVFVYSDKSGYVVVDFTSTTVLKDEYNVATLHRAYIKPAYRGQGRFKGLVEFIKGLYACSIIQILTDDEYSRIGGHKIGVVCLV